MQGVDVYFNLHRKVWSLRNRATGRVERHARLVIFPHGARFIVGQAGRARVMHTGHKNVHAYVRGESYAAADYADNWMDTDALTRVAYNPARAGHFTRTDTGERVDSASAVVMIAEGGKPPRVFALLAKESLLQA